MADENVICKCVRGAIYMREGVGIMLAGRVHLGGKGAGQKAVFVARKEV